MATKKMPIGLFVKGIGEAYARGDGYIMGATGQDPKKWKKDSWWFEQYKKNERQYEKALYWRAHAARVWDCNGLAEGLYRDYAGVDIDTQAKYDYSQWCKPKGSGLIPARYRVAGAAVFWGDSASDIHHVAYLYAPVDADDPQGDWYIIEARGVMYGVVRSKLLSRKPDYWGWMTKYFDYAEAGAEVPAAGALGDRVLENGMSGDDVKEMQTDLIRLGYDLGRWGADGDFGDATEEALRQFQRDKRLPVNGLLDAATLEALQKALAKLEKPTADPSRVQISGGKCYVRTAPNTSGKKIGVAHDGDSYPYAGETSDNGWLKIAFKGKEGWVSGKYGRLIK
ncbi:MAG: peptidoglycan-binding protein [Clostridia bacterium]|nr:peptidoglycan-binding protein [Clostridia bacterium]